MVHSGDLKDVHYDHWGGLSMRAKPRPCAYSDAAVAVAYKELPVTRWGDSKRTLGTRIDGADAVDGAAGGAVDGDACMGALGKHLGLQRTEKGGSCCWNWARSMEAKRQSDCNSLDWAKADGKHSGLERCGARLARMAKAAQ